MQIFKKNKIKNKTWLHPALCLRHQFPPPRENIYTYITDSLFCTPETNTELLINYTPIGYKN